MSERLYVRVDATPDTGLGHFMRCLALCEAWLERGGAATFIGCHDARSLERLTARGIEHHAFDASIAPEATLEATLALIPEGSLIVLDGYAFAADYQRALDAHGCLLVIDDTAHQPAYAGRWLLNQTPSAKSVPYKKAPAHRMLGVQYALLDKQLAAAPPRSQVPKRAIRWLVTLGAADAGNASVAVAEALAQAAEALGDVRICILAGPLNPHSESLINLAGRYPCIAVAQAPDNRVATLASADLAVAASGSTALELARLGVPSVLFAIADNQAGSGAALDSAGAAVYLGRWPEVTPAQLARAAADLSQDPDRRYRLTGEGQRLIDGQGARRVCDVLAASVCQTQAQP